MLFYGGNIDLYGYCLNDPVRFVDRHGLLVEADPYTAADLSIPPGTSVSIGSTLGPVDLDYNPVTGKTTVYATTPQVGISARLNFDFVKMGAFDPPDPATPYVTIGTRNLGVTYRADFSSVTFALGPAIGAPINAAIPLGEVEMHRPIDEFFYTSPCP